MSRPPSRTDRSIISRQSQPQPHSHSHSHSHSRSNSRRSSITNSISTHSNVHPDPYAFCNSFWGQYGHDALQNKNNQSSKMLEDMRLWYRERAAIEEDYAKRLSKLAKLPLVDQDVDLEVGGVRIALETVYQTTRQSAHSHLELAGTIRTALEKKLVEFINRREGLKKNPQGTIDRLWKKKTELIQLMEKSRRKYEADAIAVNGLSAQTHLVQGRDYDKVLAKLEKAQQNVQIDEREYRAHVKNLKETTTEWNMQWKSYCDLSQDLEEERIDFVRTSFWDYANGVSTICVIDDEQCENIRKSLERCETLHDVAEFVRQSRTGNEMYVAPDYINYAKGEQTPYNRPTPLIANFARSSIRNPRVAPATTNIQDLTQAIRSGPSSPTDPVHPCRSSSKAAVKRGGAIADAVATNSYPGSDPNSGLAPRPSLSRSLVGASISRAASPAEAMAQVVGGGSNPSAVSTNNRPNGRSHTPSNGRSQTPSNGPTQASSNGLSQISSKARTQAPNNNLQSAFQSTAFSDSHPNHPSINPSHDQQHYESNQPRPEASQVPASPHTAAKTLNRYIPTYNSDPSKRAYNAGPTSGSSNNGPAQAAPTGLPAPSIRPASRASTTPGIQPPSVPAENGQVDPLVAALEKLRSTPSISSFRRSPAPTTGINRPRQTDGNFSRRGTLEQPASNAQSQRASSPAPSSYRGTLDHPPNPHESYKRASSPAPSDIMMRPPSDMRSNIARSSTPQLHNGFHPSRGPSPAPSNSARPSVSSAYPPQQTHQQPQSGRPQSYNVHPTSSSTMPVGISLDTRGGIIDSSVSSRTSKIPQQSSHHHSHSQPSMGMMSSPVSYLGGSQLPFGQGPPQNIQQSMLGQQQQAIAASQTVYGAPRPPQHYGYGPTSATQQAPPPPSTTPGPIPAYQTQPTGPAQPHYSLAHSQSFSSQHQYYGSGATGPPANQVPQNSGNNNGVQRTSSVYGAPIGGHHPPSQQYYQPPPSSQSTQQPLVGQQQNPPQGALGKVPSPTGNYTESGQPILFYVRALYDYTATMPEEFSFQANDIIAITQTDPDGWWQGELLDEARRRRNGTGGNVLPSNFVDLLN